MKKIRLDDIDVVAGLEWAVVHSPNHTVSEKKAMSEFLSSNKQSKRGVVVRANGFTVVGRTEHKVSVPKKVPSAAALLAFANQKAIEHAGGNSTEATSEEHNWIVVEPVQGSTDEFWMGVVKNGIPIPGGDVVGPLNQVIDEIQEIMEASSNFTVFTRNKEVRYNVVGQVNVVEKTFAELVQGVPTKKAEIALFSIAGILAVGIIVGALLLSGAWWGYSEWSEARRQEQARISAAAKKKAQQQQIAADAKKYETDVRAAVLKALKEGMDDVKVSLSTPSAHQQTEGWRNVIYNLDLYQGGWVIQGLDCAAEAEVPVCTLLLNRGDLGTNRSLLAEHPDAVIDGDKASYVLRGSNLSNRDPDLQQVISGGDFGKGMLSDLQELRITGIKHSVEASKDVTKVAKLPPQPSLLPVGDGDKKKGAKADKPARGKDGAPTSVTIDLGFATGGIELQGDGVWQLSGVAKYLDQSNIRPKSLMVKIDPSNVEKSSWTLTLDYFVRTKPEPVIPAVPLGEEKIVVELPAEYRSQRTVDGGVTESSVSATTAIDPSATAEDSALPPQE